MKLKPEDIDVHDQLFLMLGVQFKEDIRHKRSPQGFSKTVKKELYGLVDIYFAALMMDREELYKIRGSIAEIYDCFEGIKEDSRGKSLIWTPEDFVLRPLRFQSVVSEALRQILEVVNEEYGALPDGERWNPTTQRAKELVELKEKLGKVAWSIYDRPVDLIIGGYNLFVREQGGYDAEAHEASYGYFEETLRRDPWPEFFSRTGDKTAIDRFVVALGKRKGDIESMARLIARKLKTTSYGNSREFFVDPFYNTSRNLDELVFPSARTDFITARLLSNAYLD